MGCLRKAVGVIRSDELEKIEREKREREKEY
jgi:hypothetical protein